MQCNRSIFLQNERLNEYLFAVDMRNKTVFAFYNRSLTAAEFLIDFEKIIWMFYSVYSYRYIYLYQGIVETDYPPLREKAEEEANHLRSTMLVGMSQIVSSYNTVSSHIIGKFVSHHGCWVWLYYSRLLIDFLLYIYTLQRVLKQT